MKNGKYHAKCGNKACCFEILFTMSIENTNIENNLFQMKEKENIQKEKIIKQKMETLFGYKELSISIKEFKKQINGIMQENEKLLKIEEKYTNLFENKERDELIEKQHINIKKEINDLNKLYLSNEKTMTEDIVNTNYRISKMYVELRKYNYNVSEIQFSYNDNSIVSKLVKTSIHLYNNENTIDPVIEIYFMKPIVGKIK